MHAGQRSGGSSPPTSWVGGPRFWVLGKFWGSVSFMDPSKLVPLVVEFRKLVVALITLATILSGLGWDFTQRAGERRLTQFIEREADVNDRPEWLYGSGTSEHD